MQMEIHDTDANFSSSHRFGAKHPLFLFQDTDLPHGISEWMKKFEHFVIVGMGGSSLPLKVFVDAASLGDRIHFLDHLSSEALDRFLKLPQSLFCIVSKSGETLEVQTLMAEILKRSPQADLLIVTDPEKGSLRKLATERAIKTLPIPSAIGGRFTHFTPLHRALLERFQVDFSALVSQAEKKRDELKKDSSVLAKIFAIFFEHSNRNLVLFAYGSKLLGLAEWIQQAIAESLGKKTKAGNRCGIFPIVLKGPQDQHSVLQLLMDGPQTNILWFLGMDEKASELKKVEKILEDSTFQSFQERLSNAETRQPLIRWALQNDMKEITDAIVTIDAFIEYAADRLEINAFDQPGVERGKQIARELLTRNHHR